MCTSAWIAAAVLACGGRYAAGFCAVGLVEEAFVETCVGFGPWPTKSSRSSNFKEQNIKTRYKMK